MTATCNKNLIILKHTDFPTQNGLIYTDFFLNILRTQNTALGTVMRGGAEFKIISPEDLTANLTRNMSLVLQEICFLLLCH